MNALLRHGPHLDVRTRDGRNCGILARKELMVEEDDGTLTRYAAEPNTTGELDDTDGASDPYLAQVISHLLGLDIDPTGDYWPGAVFHDLIFRGRLKQWINGEWVPIKRVKSNPVVSAGEMDLARANSLFKALMFGLGIDNKKATVIYEALVAFGQKAWDEDSKLFV